MYNKIINEMAVESGDFFQKKRWEDYRQLNQRSDLLKQTHIFRKRMFK